ncbi:DMT family transporter [Oceanobacillus sp. Castelsardo]|uniref:DMT family transporter n=1 Tax=Oceanobacillus sp. Castelsardo TaxID=1851204 RepID=UPI0008387DB0|nr:DMT family transporter [Oceanobacillus sp. Castelsardo]
MSYTQCIPAPPFWFSQYNNGYKQCCKHNKRRNNVRTDHSELPFDAPFSQLIGAVFGVFLIYYAVVVPRIGMMNWMVMVIIGQLLSSVIIDHFSLFGSEVILLDWRKLIGVILLIIVAYFIFKHQIQKEKRKD